MKKLYIKSFDTDGEFIKAFDDFSISSFSKRINTGISSMTVKLARRFDNFNPNGDVSLGNKLELWVTDIDTGATPRKVYTGYVEQQVPKIDGNEEFVEVVCLSIASYLTQDILKNGSQTTLFTKATDGLTVTEGDKTATEVADLLKAVVDRFRSENDGLELNYSSDNGDTIEETGKTLDYTFKATRYSDVIKKCKDTAPQNWYWYIDENEIIYFKAVPSLATHTFTIGKDIRRVEVNKGLDSIKNVILLFDGDTTYKQYKDDTSISLYGRRVKQITDLGIGDETSMDNIGESFLAENKDPRIRIVMEVIDNNEADGKGYDIESIQPGETCKIVGINPVDEIFSENMIIQEVEWYDKYVKIIIETRQDFDFDVFLLNLRKDIDTQSTENIPQSYT